jgi:type IV secretory pathway TraG/TraD family ATPase VirD4
MENLIDWSSINGPKDAKIAAMVLFPKVSAEKEEYFWTEAARTVLAAILTKLGKDNKGNDFELKKTFFLSPSEIFRLLPAGSEAARYGHGGDKQIAAIIHTIFIRLNMALFDAIESETDIHAVAVSLIPAPAGEDRFWDMAAQDVLKGLLAYCYRNGKRSNIELWHALASPIKDVADMCKATKLGQAGYCYIRDTDSKQAACVIGVLMSHLSWLEFGLTREKGKVIS